MKKIALTIAAVAALGLAACDNARDDAANNTADLNATENEAYIDVNESANETGAVNSTNDALDSVGDAVENTASDVGNAAEDAADAVANTAKDATN
jgi:hypothetical protein